MTHANLAAKLSIAVIVLLAAACTSTPEVASIPTLAVLPSATPTETLIPTPIDTATATPLPTNTVTPDLPATEMAQLQLTNVAGEQTLAALQTLMAASPTFTPTPSLTITDTLTPTITLTPTPAAPPVESMQPELLYVRALANVRACANRSCPPVSQLREGDRVMATGTTLGEAITRGNTLWYRIDQQGQPYFIYSDLVADAPPTRVPTQAVVANPSSTDCNSSDILDWMLASSEAVADLYALDVGTIQAARDRIAATRYPQCAEVAQQYLLQALDEAVLMAQAENSYDFDSALDHLNKMSSATDAYLSALSELLDLPYTGSVSSYPSGASGSILCNDGTISNAANTQGACSGHGGIWQLPTSVPYTGTGGGSTCADGTHSNSTGRGTCSHHGGIAH